MSDQSNEQSRAARIEQLNRELETVPAKLELTQKEITRRGAARRPGDILLEPGEKPELLLIEQIDDSWWVLPLDEDDTIPREDILNLEDELAGAITVHLRGGKWIRAVEVAAYPRTGVLTDASLAHVQLEGGGAPRESTPLGELIPLESAKKRTRAVVAATLGFLASAAAAALLFLLPRAPVRDDPGLYRLRGVRPGEIGAELYLGDQRCLARGVKNNISCAVVPEVPVDVKYRLDEGMSHEYAVVLERSESATRVLFPNAKHSEPLLPTTEGGRERCAGGLCSLTRVKKGVGTLWVIFLAEPVDPDALPKGDPSEWPNAVPYRFDLK